MNHGEFVTGFIGNFPDLNLLDDDNRIAIAI
jgi:hypothetical protein